MELPVFLRPLSSRNYRLYFLGQTVSLTGTWMSQTASLWLVYHLSASVFLLGVVGFVSQVPALVFGPIAGVLVDRVDRRRVLLATQFLFMLQTLAMAFFVLTGTVRVVHLVVLSLAQGVITAFDAPTRQSLVVVFVEKRENLGRAIALNSSMFNLARLVGPALGGIAIAAWGAGVCYLVDGLSFGAVIASLLAMHMPPDKAKEVQQSHWTDMREGFRYALGFLPVRVMLILVCVVSFFAFPYLTLMPVFARDILHGDARTLGFLMSATGIGALVGALYLGSRKSGRGLGGVIVAGGTIMGIGLIGFALSPFLPLSLLFIAAVGMGGVLMLATGNTFVQAIVDDDKRGRVMSLYATSFIGVSPFGNLAMGAIAEHVGVRVVFAVCGAITIAAVAVFHRVRPQIREASLPVMYRLDMLSEQVMR